MRIFRNEECKMKWNRDIAHRLIQQVADGRAAWGLSERPGVPDNSDRRDLGDLLRSKRAIQGRFLRCLTRT